MSTKGARRGSSHMLRDVTHTFWSGTRVQAFRSTARCPWQRAPYHVYLPLLMAAGSITFLSGRQIRPGSTCIHDRKKRRRPDREAEAERKTPFQRKSCTKSVGSRGAVVSAALSERKVAGSIPTIGDFHTVGPCKKAVFACLATDAK